MSWQDHLPARVVVGENGAYWRDFGDWFSMCVVSTDNDPVVPVAVYERVRPGSLVLSPGQVAKARELLDVICRDSLEGSLADVVAAGREAGVTSAAFCDLVALLGGEGRSS